MTTTGAAAAAAAAAAGEDITTWDLFSRTKIPERFIKKYFGL
jgi:hypothetical protein